MVNSAPKQPVTFNTGQILLGLAAGAAEFGAEPYRRAMNLAADWLLETQDPRWVLASGADAVCAARREIL